MTKVMTGGKRVKVTMVFNSDPVFFRATSDKINKGYAGYFTPILFYKWHKQCFSFSMVQNVM